MPTVGVTDTSRIVDYISNCCSKTNKKVSTHCLGFGMDVDDVFLGESDNDLVARLKKETGGSVDD